MRSEWDEAKQHDVLFLLTIRPPGATELAHMRTQGAQLNPMELYGLAYVRGCEVIEVKDEGGPLALCPTCCGGSTPVRDASELPLWCVLLTAAPIE